MATDGSDKKACKTDRFKLIYEALKPGESFSQNQETSFCSFTELTSYQTLSESVSVREAQHSHCIQTRPISLSVLPN